jgi:hypothetical protein
MLPSSSPEGPELQSNPFGEETVYLTTSHLSSGAKAAGASDNIRPEPISMCRHAHRRPLSITPGRVAEVHGKTGMYRDCALGHGAHASKLKLSQGGA